jgi:hypothetical protein
VKGGNLNLNEDDGLTPWMRVIIKKYFILKQFRGALSAESFDRITEDEYAILEIIIQEMGKSDDSGNEIFGA